MGATVWLFNIRPENWAHCVGGPPDRDVHDGHVGQPWHGLSSHIAYVADRLQPGDTAIVQKSGHGIAGVWTVEATAPVRDQDDHEWADDYAHFVYCRPLVRELDEPLDDTTFIDGPEFARFNRAANALSPEYVERYITHLLADVDLPENVRRVLELDRELVRESRNVAETRAATREGRQSAAGTVRNYTVETVEVGAGFRDRVLRMYDNQCLLTEFTGSPFVTLSHVVPRAEDVQVAEHPDNVMVLNWLHHQAFDAGLFTFTATTVCTFIRSSNPRRSSLSEHSHSALANRCSSRTARPSAKRSSRSGTARSTGGSVVSRSIRQQCDLWSGNGVRSPVDLEHDDD